MFGTEIHWTTFIILLVQITLLPFLYINYLYDTKNVYRRRFLKLTLTFIFYNLFSGLFPDENIEFVPMLLQNIIAYGVGIIYVLYFVYYIYNEFHIAPYKFFSVNSIILYLTTLFIVLFLIPQLLGYDLNTTRKLFIFIPLILAIIYSIKTSIRLFHLYQKESKNALQKHYKLRVISANVGVFSLLMLPIIISFGDYQYIEQPLVNLGYFVMLNAYLKNQIYNQRKNNLIINELSKNSSETTSIETLFNNFQLTTKEKEIASLILEGHKYKEIADLVFITDKTVSKHASNIFKKTAVKNRKEFESNFS